MAFGYGAHRCLGAHLARLVMRVLLARLVSRVATLKVIDRTPCVEDHGAVSRRAGYRALTMRFTGKSPS